MQTSPLAPDTQPCSANIPKLTSKITSPPPNVPHAYQITSAASLMLTKPAVIGTIEPLFFAGYCNYFFPIFQIQSPIKATQYNFTNSKVDLGFYIELPCTFANDGNAVLFN